MAIAAICTFCNKPADGPMLTMGKAMAHSDCVIRRLNELLDPFYDGEGEPEQLVGALDRSVVSKDAITTTLSAKSVVSMTDLCQTIEEVRMLLEEKMVVCHSPDDLGGDVGTNCSVPDLQYAPLLELFRAKCEHPNSAWRDTMGFQAFCPDCGAEWEPTPENLQAPQGHVTRLDWLTLPEGCLAGAIGHAMDELLDGDLDELVRAWDWQKDERYLDHQPNLTAMLALKAVLNG